MAVTRPQRRPSKLYQGKNKTGWSHVFHQVGVTLRLSLLYHANALQTTKFDKTCAAKLIGSSVRIRVLVQPFPSEVTARLAACKRYYASSSNNVLQVPRTYASMTVVAHGLKTLFRNYTQTCKP